MLSNKNIEDKDKNNKIIAQDEKITELNNKLNQFEETFYSMKENTHKIEKLSRKSKTLEQLYNSTLPQIQCPFGHELINPVTVIPCGHNYCLGCKRGYTKDCSQCSGKLKI